jgi:hypothetical protein
MLTDEPIDLRDYPSPRHQGNPPMISPHAFRSRLLVLALASVAPASATAQPRRQATPDATLKSTEVAADHKVTFRIYAPK